MFDFLKRKSYKIEEANGMKKIVVAKKYTASDFDSYIKRLNDAKAMLEAVISGLTEVKKRFTLEDEKDLPEYMKKKISNKPIDWNFDEEDKILKVFGSLDIQKKLEEVKEKSQDIEDETNKVSDLTKSEPKKGENVKEVSEETNKGSEETNKGDEDLNIESILGDISTEDNKDEQSKEEGMEKKTSLSSKDLKRTADKAPGSSKYRAEGIKERLLEINKEVVNVKTPGVTYVGGVGKDVITPGPKSTMVRVKEEVVRPNNVVEHVKIKIMREEGEKERLLPDRNIKMPKGDNVILKASTDTIELKKNLPQDKKEEAIEILQDQNKSDETKETELKAKGLGASLYDEVMFKVFADKEFEEFEETTEEEGIETKELDPELQKILYDIDKNI